MTPNVEDGVVKVLCLNDNNTLRAGLGEGVYQEGDIIKCEKCGQEMKEGFLGSDSYLIFTKEKKKFIPKNYEYIAQAPTGIHQVYIPAKVCFNCKKGSFTFD